MLRAAAHRASSAPRAPRRPRPPPQQCAARPLQLLQLRRNVRDHNLLRAPAGRRRRAVRYIYCAHRRGRPHFFRRNNGCNGATFYGCCHQPWFEALQCLLHPARDLPRRPRQQARIRPARRLPRLSFSPRSQRGPARKLTSPSATTSRPLSTIPRIWPSSDLPCPSTSHSKAASSTGKRLSAAAARTTAHSTLAS
eukprot:SAG31_NODE_310_length_17887_cov_4.623060_2_plen_195_part_00